jgi:type IV pilus assembly protein PilC
LPDRKELSPVPEFWYQALGPSGQVEHGTMTAADAQEVQARLRADGTYLVRAEVRGRKAERYTDGKIERKQLLALLEYLAGGTQVGMPILTTLEDVAPRLDSKRLQQIVLELRDSMFSEGTSLSEAMAQHPKAFPQYYITTIQAGEASGQLDYVLRQLVEHLDWQENISAQLKQAITYPIVVVIAIALLIGVLVGFVFPRLIPVITSRSVDIPTPTRIVMAASDFIRTWWLSLIILISGSIIAIGFMRQSQQWAEALDRLVLRIPGVGDLMLAANMARLVTYLALFHRSGVEFIYSLTLLERLMGNRAVAAAVRQAREAVEHGSTIASAFGRSPLFPPIVVRSMALGETTGHLDEALARTMAYYAREVPAAVKRAITILQPALIGVMGGAILLVGLAIILPILGIYSSIGRR